MSNHDIVGVDYCRVDNNDAYDSTRVTVKYHLCQKLQRSRVLKTNQPAQIMNKIDGNLMN